MMRIFATGLPYKTLQSVAFQTVLT
jgi:hypothetical protein